MFDSLDVNSCPAASWCVLDMQEKGEFQLPQTFFWEFGVPQGPSGRGRMMGEESIIHVWEKRRIKM